MKSTLAPALLLALSLTSAGCASLKKTDNSTGLLDAVMILTGAEPDVALIETSTCGRGYISSARAVADHGHLLVYGTVKKQACYTVTTATSHIEVVVLNAEGKIIETASTDYCPSEIPNTTSRSIAVSSYSVHLPTIPPPGSKVKVVFCDTPKAPMQAR